MVLSIVTVPHIAVLLSQTGVWVIVFAVTEIRDIRRTVINLTLVIIVLMIEKIITWICENPAKRRVILVPVSALIIINRIIVVVVTQILIIIHRLAAQF